MENTSTNSKPHMSRIRRLYFIKLVIRVLIFISCILVWRYRPEMLDILYGFNFFKKLSVFHVLWVIWMLDMLWQLVPRARKNISLGSIKLFEMHFKPIVDPILERINYPALKEYIIHTTKSAYKVFIIWAAVTLGIGILFLLHIIDGNIIFLISVFFYVCDLICVVIWCPFRLIMRNRCCTTCRIFNWDHLMMFIPLLYVPGFYTWTLLLMALAVWIVWELCVMMYPERFWEMTNVALRCSECTDKLCTQYCQKLRDAVYMEADFQKLKDKILE